MREREREREKATPEQAPTPPQSGNAFLKEHGTNDLREKNQEKQLIWKQFCSKLQRDNTNIFGSF